MKTDNMNPSKPYVYDGTRYDSTFEAMWAMYLKTMGIPFQYSPEKIRYRAGGYYLPDFKIITSDQNRDFFIECKGNVTFDATEKVRALAKENDVIMIYGSFPNDISEYLDEFHQGERENGGVVNSSWFLSSGRFVRPLIPAVIDGEPVLADVYDIIQRPENFSVMESINDAFRKTWDTFYGKEAKMMKLKQEHGIRIKHWRTSLGIKGPLFVLMFSDDEDISYQSAAGIMSSIERGLYRDENTRLVEKMLLWIDELPGMITDGIASEGSDSDG